MKTTDSKVWGTAIATTCTRDKHYGHVHRQQYQMHKAKGFLTSTNPFHHLTSSAQCVRMHSIRKQPLQYSCCELYCTQQAQQKRNQNRSSFFNCPQRPNALLIKPCSFTLHSQMYIDCLYIYPLTSIAHRAEPNTTGVWSPSKPK